jgi:hypothetical protein
MQILHADSQSIGEIKCRFENGSREVRHLGEFFRLQITKNYEPHFEVVTSGPSANVLQVSARRLAATMIWPRLLTTTMYSFH